MPYLLRRACLLVPAVLAVCLLAGPVHGSARKADADMPLITYDLTRTQRYSLTTPAGRSNAWGECHVVAALQGLVNRSGPRLYLYFNTDDGNQPGRLDRFWLSILRQPGGWLVGKKLEPIDSFTQLVAKFRSAYRGVVLYDLNVPATSHVASTIAGCDNLLPIAYDPAPGSVYDRLVAHGPHLPIKVRLLHDDGTPMFTGTETGSAKCDAYMWAKRNYLDTGKCNPALLGYYIDSLWIRYPGADVTWNELCSADYLIQHKAFFFDLCPWEDEAPQDDPGQRIGTDNRTMCAILLSAYNRTHGQRIISAAGFPPIGWKYTASHGGHHGDVETEWHYAAVVSCFNAILDSGDTPMANASVFSRFPLKARYAQHKPTIADWKKAGYVDAAGKVAPHQYVAYYVGDYDCAAWMYQYLPRIWNDKARGSVPLGWAFNPNLSDRFPVGMDWTRTTAKQSDSFICGDSGAGYLNPGYLDGPRPYSHLPSGVAAWARACRYWYSRFDLSISGFVIDGVAGTMSKASEAAYASFSPDGVIDQYTPKQPAYFGTSSVPALSMELYLVPPAIIPDAIANTSALLRRDTGAGPHFHMWRTVLWTPTEHMELMRGLERAMPNVRVVDPYTLMGLEKMSLLHGAH